MRVNSQNESESYELEQLEIKPNPTEADPKMW